MTASLFWVRTWFAANLAWTALVAFPAAATEPGGASAEAAPAPPSRISRLVIELPGGDPNQTIEVWLDRNLLGGEALGMPMPVEPGTHEITVMATGRVPWSVKLELSPATTTKISVPVLAPLDPTRSAAAREAEPTPAIASGLDSSVADRSDDPGRAQRTIGWALGGAGVSGLALGTYFAIRASSTRNDMQCDNNRCPISELDQLQHARSEARIANWALGFGATSLAAGVIVYVLAPSKKAATALQLTPVFGPKTAGLTARARF